MKKVLALTLMAVLAFSGVALAASLPFGSWPLGSRTLRPRTLQLEHGCERTKIIRCRRESRSRVDCGVATYYWKAPSVHSSSSPSSMGGTVNQRTRQVRCRRS